MRNPIFDSSLRNVTKFFFTFISQELFSVRLEKAVNNGKIMLSSSIFRGTLLLFMTPHRYIPTFPVWFTNVHPKYYLFQTESIFQERSRNHFLQACAVLCNCLIWVSIWHGLYYNFTTRKSLIVPPKSLAYWGHQKIPQKYFFVD